MGRPSSRHAMTLRFGIRSMNCKTRQFVHPVFERLTPPESPQLVLDLPLHRRGIPDILARRRRSARQRHAIAYQMDRVECACRDGDGLPAPHLHRPERNALSVGLVILVLPGLSRLKRPLIPLGIVLRATWIRLRQPVEVQRISYRALRSRRQRAKVAIEQDAVMCLPDGIYRDAAFVGKRPRPISYWKKRDPILPCVPCSPAWTFYALGKYRRRRAERAGRKPDDRGSNEVPRVHGIEPAA